MPPADAEQFGSAPSSGFLAPAAAEHSAPVICIASASSAPAVLTHRLMPEPHQVRPPPPQPVLYSSGPPQTCSD
ncbi:hypothetical protein E4T56_gene5481 [Termitomyces sp. T112]|nr:hypothetical protein E4T56_gene5481 [Termitomyces sp. T112]